MSRTTDKCNAGTDIIQLKLPNGESFEIDTENFPKFMPRTLIEFTSNETVYARTSMNGVYAPCKIRYAAGSKQELIEFLAYEHVSCLKRKSQSSAVEHGIKRQKICTTDLPSHKLIIAGKRHNALLSTKAGKFVLTGPSSGYVEVAPREACNPKSDSVCPDGCQYFMSQVMEFLANEHLNCLSVSQMMEKCTSTSSIDKLVLKQNKPLPNMPKLTRAVVTSNKGNESENKSKEASLDSIAPIAYEWNGNSLQRVKLPPSNSALQSLKLAHSAVDKSSLKSSGDKCETSLASAPDNKSSNGKMKSKREVINLPSLYPARELPSLKFINPLNKSSTVKLSENKSSSVASWTPTDRKLNEKSQRDVISTVKLSENKSSSLASWTPTDSKLNEKSKRDVIKISLPDDVEKELEALFNELIKPPETSCADNNTSKLCDEKSQEEAKFPPLLFNAKNKSEASLTSLVNNKLNEKSREEAKLPSLLFYTESSKSELASLTSTDDNLNGKSQQGIRLPSPLFTAENKYGDSMTATDNKLIGKSQQEVQIPLLTFDPENMSEASLTSTADNDILNGKSQQNVKIPLLTFNAEIMSAASQTSTDNHSLNKKPEQEVKIPLLTFNAENMSEASLTSTDNSNLNRNSQQGVKIPSPPFNAENKCEDPLTSTADELTEASEKKVKLPPISVFFQTKKNFEAPSTSAANSNNKLNEKSEKDVKFSTSNSEMGAFQLKTPSPAVKPSKFSPSNCEMETFQLKTPNPDMKPSKFSPPNCELEKFQSKAPNPAMKPSKFSPPDCELEKFQSKAPNPAMKLSKFSPSNCELETFPLKMPNPAAVKPSNPLLVIPKSKDVSIAPLNSPDSTIPVNREENINIQPETKALPQTDSSALAPPTSASCLVDSRHQADEVEILKQMLQLKDQMLQLKEKHIAVLQSRILDLQNQRILFRSKSKDNLDGI